MRQRALVSIGVTGAGLWDGLPPAFHIGGLFEVPGSTDGSAASCFWSSANSFTSSSMSRQNEPSSVFDSRQART